MRQKLLRPGPLLLVTLPLAFWLMSLITLRWDWVDSCSSYGFPFPHTTWAHTYLGWFVSPLFFGLDLLFYCGVALGIQYALDRWVPAPRLLAKFSAGFITFFGYIALYFLLLFPACVGMWSPKFHVFKGELETVNLYVGVPEDCPNQNEDPGYEKFDNYVSPPPVDLRF